MSSTRPKRFNTGPSTEGPVSEGRRSWAIEPTHRRGELSGCREQREASERPRGTASPHWPSSPWRSPRSISSGVRRTWRSVGPSRRCRHSRWRRSGSSLPVGSPMRGLAHVGMRARRSASGETPLSRARCFLLGEWCGGRGGTVGALRADRTAGRFGTILARDPRRALRVQESAERTRRRRSPDRVRRGRATRGLPWRRWPT